MSFRQSNNSEIAAARHYTMIAYAIRTINWKAKEWGARALERYNREEYEGRHSATVAKIYKTKLYTQKNLGLIYLLKNKAADLKSLRCQETDTLRVRIPAGENGYCCHTTWSHIPCDLARNITFDTDYVFDISVTLEFDDKYDYEMNITDSLKLLEGLNL